MAPTYQVEGYAEPDVITDQVLSKYTTAAEVVHKTITQILEKCLAGANTQELCVVGDQIIHDSTQAVYKNGFERGSAEPTTISVNNCFCGYSPMDSVPYILQAGDVVKVSLGAHIDGYTAKQCHTTVVREPGGEGPLSNTAADAIVAAYYASEAILRLLASASMNNVVNANRIRQVVQEAATAFDVRVVDGSRVRRIKRYLVGQARIEDDAIGTDQAKQVEWMQHVPGTPFVEDEEFVVEQGEAWLVDIAMSTGTGKVKEHLTLRPTIFSRDVAVTYNMKLKAAQQTLREIDQTKSVFPFCLRSLSDQRTAKLGISECRTKNVVQTYPVLVEHPKATIARQSSTILIHKSGTNSAIRLTGGKASQIPWVKSQYEVQQGTELANIISSGDSIRIKEIANSS